MLLLKHLYFESMDLEYQSFREAALKQLTEPEMQVILEIHAAVWTCSLTQIHL